MLKLNYISLQSILPPISPNCCLFGLECTGNTAHCQWATRLLLSIGYSNLSYITMVGLRVPPN